MIVAREFAMYKLDSVGVQEVTWNKGGILRAGDYILLKRKRKSLIKNRIFLHHRILSAVKTVEFVSDRMAYIVLRGRWCNIVVLNTHATSEELDQVFQSSSQVPYENSARRL